jgi:glycosyltransferase involved in cell wall biosynthesis
MTIGFVHVGAPAHGVSRYGRLLAAEAKSRTQLRVLEHELQFTGTPSADRERVMAAARSLSAADVIHIQYNDQREGCVWGAGWNRLSRLRLFARTAGAPLVVTLHDVAPRQGGWWRDALRRPVASLARAWAAGPQASALHWLRMRSSRLLVCGNEERARLSRVSRRVSVVPHFVEARDLQLTRSEAKAALGFSGRRIVTLLGFIHQRKGHALLIDALPLLPSDVVAVCAGSAPGPDSAFVALLAARARELGVADRLRITGFLSEQELAPYLAATDVAVCPFISLSASGSLSTWISAVRPILASDLPQIAEYNALEPGAIRTFRPYTSRALADAITETLARSPEDADGAIARLRATLLMPAVFDRHLEVYREVLARPGSPAPEPRFV